LQNARVHISGATSRRTVLNASHDTFVRAVWRFHSSIGSDESCALIA
jgi:hypothetical protein